LASFGFGKHLSVRLPFEVDQYLDIAS